MFGMLMHYEKTTASTAMMINVLANENCSFMAASYRQRKEKARRACAEGCPGQGGIDATIPTRSYRAACW